MLTVTYRKHGIRLSHVYFATEEDIKQNKFKENVGDLIFLHGTNIAPNGGTLYTTQHTLIKDLSLSEEELYLSLGKHLRKHISKSIREQETDIRFYTSSEILQNIQLLDICKNLYEKMFTDKGLNNSFNKKLAEIYCKKDALVIGLCTINNEPVGFCAMLCYEENARAWVSAFDFRNKNRDPHLMSRAQRRLNWERMIWCKNNGIKSFDFGGINSFEEPNGIAQFKMEFEHNNKVTYENYLVSTNLIGKLALKYFFRK